MRSAHGRAPARVNLLGGHTDYNEGYVLPTVLPYWTEVEVGEAAEFSAYSENLAEERAIKAGVHRSDWTDYLAGVIWSLEQAGYRVPAVSFHVSSTVPIGVGLSSSAALTVAALKALRELLGLAMDDLQTALMAQRAESDYAGVRCGVMDPMAVSLGVPDKALFIDTRSLERRFLPLFRNVQVVVVDSATPRRLAAGEYNRRREECQEAARLLGVAALRDLDDEKEAERLPEPYRKRARHVILENRRVLEAAAALEAGDAVRFGALMLAAHRSLRDDFEVSTPQIDRIVELSMVGGALGARLTGAGFGGAVVALVPDREVGRFFEVVREGYPRARFF